MTLINYLRKRILIKILFGFYLLLWFSCNAFGQRVIQLSSSIPSIHPKEQVAFFRSDRVSQDLQQILSPQIQKKFTYAGKETITFGISQKPIWFKIEVKNTTPLLQSNYILEVAYPHLDTLEFYYQDEKGKWQKHVTGDLFPFNTRVISNKHFAFPISFTDTTTHTFYFLVTGDGSRQFPLYIQTPDKFYSEQAKIDITYGGAFFGILLVMLLYNLFIYLSLKEKAYLYYVIMNGCVFILYQAYSGYGFQYLWSNSPWINLKMIPLTVLLHGTAGTIFTRNFLATKKYTPFLHKILGLILIAYSIAIPSLLIFNYDTSLKIAVTMAFTNAAIVFITSYSVWIMGNKFARFMAISFVIYLVGIILLTLNIGGILERSFIVAHSMEIGTMFEITMLSFALGDKYSAYRREKEKAQAELIEVQKKINEQLEQKVNERTVELQNLNKVKDKLLSIISHDLKGPLNVMQSLVTMMRTDKVNEENNRTYSMHFSNKLSAMSSLLDNILQWIRSQREGLKFNIQTISLKDAVNAGIAVVNSQAELKGVTIEDNTDKNVKVKADKNVLFLVMRNLLTNAVKFTESKGKVTITTIEKDHQIHVEVKDTGVGISEQKLKLLFNQDTHFSTPDTAKNEGTGLGLLLCQDFLSKTGGTIRAESEPGKGSRFIFTLPKAID